MWLFLLACAGPDPSPTDTGSVDLLDLLGSEGAHDVGHRDDQVTYADPVSGADRTLHLSTWYPTNATDGEEATYFSGAITAEGVWQDAPPEAGPFPVVVMSHGHQAYAEYASFLAEHLASHGWIVAAPDHTGNTTLDGSDRTTEIYAQRPLDISAVLDWVDTNLTTTDTRVLIGHSFGGYTALALAGAAYDPAALDCPDPTTPFCSTMTPTLRSMFEAGFFEPRFQAAIVMAPGDFEKFGADGVGAISLPVFHMTGTEDQGPGSEADDLWAALEGGENRRLILEGAGHQSFTDFADVMEDVPMSAEESSYILDVYSLAWALRTDGDEVGAPVLDGDTEVSPDATLLK